MRETQTGDDRTAVVSDRLGMYQLQTWAPTDLEHVRAFLRRQRDRVNDDARATGRDSVPGSRAATHARSELLGCVADWNAFHPARAVELRQP